MATLKHLPETQFSPDCEVSECTREFIVRTDVAAGGRDVPNITHVVLFDVPTDICGFINHAGRTARRGQKGLIACLLKTRSADYARNSHYNLHAH